jgi:PAS domain S-box-containing protein
MEINDKKENRVIYSYLAIYIIIGIFFAIASYQYVKDLERHFKTNVKNQLGLTADLKVHELEHWRDEQHGIAEILFENEAFANITKRYFNNPTDRAAKREIHVWMQEFQTAFNYNAVILTDPKLDRKIIFPEAAERQKAYISPCNIDSLNAGKLVFEDFYRDDFKQKVFLKVLIPILDAHQLIGVIELRIDPKTYLYTILANWPIPSPTSETYIVRREDNKAVYLNELRFRKNSVLNLKVPLANKNVTAVRAVLGQKGFVEGVIDYRGKAVVAYLKKVPNSPWYLVVKEDDSEAYAPLRIDIWSVIILAFGVFLMIGFGLLFLWRHQRTLFYKERIKSAEALQKLNLAIYNSQEIVFLTDIDGIITYINPEFTKIYGYTAEDVVGMTTPRIINSGLNKKEDSKLLWDALLNKQTIPKTEYINKRKDGKLIEIEGSANPVIDQDGNIIGFLGVQRDITERKRSELEKQVMYDITHEVTTTSNLDELLKLIQQSLGKVLYADNIFIALYDQKTELFSFPYWVDEFDPIPEPAAMRKSLTAYVFRTGKPMLFSQELFQHLKEQNEVELVGSPSPSWVGVPLQTPNKTIGVLVLQHYKKENVYSERDLQFLDSVGSQIAMAVERKLAEQELSESEIKLNVILQSTADGILAVDGKGKVIKTNKRFADLLHIPQSLIDSEDDQTFISFVMNQLTHPDELISKELKLYRSTDEDLDVLYLKDGRTFERYSVPMILDDSSIGRVWSLRDITDRKRAEEELKNSQEQLKKFAIHLQNAREQEKVLLATQLDNELGQMLVALKMDIGMLKQNVVKGNIGNISADLVAKLDQANNLIGNSISNTMKIMNDLRYEVLYLMGFIEAVNLYITEFQEKNRINCVLDSDIVKLDMDEKKATSLFRIFQNAMSNVVQHSKATEVKINLYQTKEKLVLEITDNGIGFDPEKSSNEASNRFIYMKERASLMGGEFLITSLPNRGTNIRVEIPYPNK